MKKILLVVTSIIALITFVACGGNNTSTNTTSTAEESTKQEASVTETTTIPIADKVVTGTEYKLGETVSTNTTDFTLENAVFTIACKEGEDYLMPTEYVNMNDVANTHHVAAIGETLVALTFTITNNNRTNLNIAYPSFSSEKNVWCFDWNVEYEGETYPLEGQDNDNKLQFRYAILSNDGSSWKLADSHNKIMKAGETLTARTYGRIETDVNDLQDGFKMTINVPSSNGYELFTYIID